MATPERDITKEPFAVALDRIMRERGLTQEGLAAMSEDPDQPGDPVARTTVNRYLSGARGRQINKQTVKTMSDIALALDPDLN
jgi:transcriptional regulator with XRE-family HTH domain